MKQILQFICILILVQFSCNTPNQQTKESKKDTSDQHNISQQNTMPDNTSKAAAFTQFNTLEKLFGNDNYMTLSGKDTTYTYFSRVSEYLIKCYSYKMIRGDSANSRIDSIKSDAGNIIKWNFNNLNLSLENSTALNSNWSVVGTDSIHYQFQKIDNKTIRFLQAGSAKKTLIKTITLSTFLVRSFYDYEHGTKLAYDSTNFTKK
jgi:hypothetical protein